ncbi:LLM class flavin-dependent oxidoreductase [Candidatus Bathyarchaeota archaeon]|nr:LLM class flavin-dependent oxidoreductase [Candidatus Bathyarchaeota archaeon]
MLDKLTIVFGVHMGLHGLYNYEAFLETSQLADRLGYEYITVGDHLFNPPDFYKQAGGDPEKPDKLDAWTALAALAAKTTRAKLGTRVSPIPFYQPSRLAKIVATVDIISGGRAVLGAGAGAGGWKDEFVAYGLGWWRHKERIGRMIEGLEIMLRLWTEEETTFKGQYYSIKEAPFWPKPIQKPHPPILFGGSGEDIVNATAKYGDLIVPPGPSLEDVNNRLRKAEEQQNRKSPAMLGSSLTPNDIGTSPSQWFDNIESQMRKGVSLLLIDLSSTPIQPEEAQGFLKEFAVEVFPKFNSHEKSSRR